MRYSVVKVGVRAREWEMDGVAREEGVIPAGKEGYRKLECFAPGRLQVSE